MPADTAWQMDHRGRGQRQGLPRRVFRDAGRRNRHRICWYPKSAGRVQPPRIKVAPRNVYSVLDKIFCRGRFSFSLRPGSLERSPATAICWRAWRTATAGAATPSWASGPAWRSPVGTALSASLNRAGPAPSLPGLPEISCVRSCGITRAPGYRASPPSPAGWWATSPMISSATPSPT